MPFHSLRALTNRHLRCLLRSTCPPGDGGLFFFFSAAARCHWICFSLGALISGDRKSLDYPCRLLGVLLACTSAAPNRTTSLLLFGWCLLSSFGSTANPQCLPSFVNMLTKTGCEAVMFSLFTFRFHAWHGSRPPPLAYALAMASRPW